MLKGRPNIQMHLGRQEEWANRNMRKFNMDKCKVPHLGSTNPCNSHRPGTACLWSSSVGKALAVLLGQS